MEDFKRRAGLKIVHVPYQGSPKAMLDLMAGNVQVGLDTITVTQPHVQSGRMRLIAAGTASRLPAFANTPTIAEQGYPGFEAVAWLALSAPAGTPRELRERINADVVQALKTPEFAAKLVAMGAFPRPGSTDEFGAFLKSEYTRWGEIVRASGAKVD
jgi:tripartite-type tricarboxylate transporter receptor subunit TctC